MRTIRLACPAKINLFLEILGRRSDGFHEIVTVMTPISLHDRLEITPADRFSLEVSGIRIDGPNTVEKAYQAVARRRSIPPVAVLLTKRIPAGAGLGGGSSNAASMIEALDEAFQLNLDRAEAAAEVGSDVPFFLAKKPAICTGCGEQIQPLSTQRRLDFVLLFPPVEALTREVYARTSAHLASPRRDVSEFLHAYDSGTTEQLEELLFNRLEGPALDRYPILNEWIRRLGPGARLTGSGSTIFRLCPDEGSARELARNTGGTYVHST